MNAIQMIELRGSQPFVPFEIHLSDGDLVRVQQPYQIATRPNSPTCVILTDDDETRIVAYRNITEVITVRNGE